MKIWVVLGGLLVASIVLSRVHWAESQPVHSDPAVLLSQLDESRQSHASHNFRVDRPTVEESKYLPLLRAIKNETDPDQKSEALDRALVSISDIEVPSVLNFLVGQSGTDAAELRQLLVRRWAEQNPEAAAEWAVSIAEKEDAARDLIKQVAIVWAENDSSKAMEWVQKLSDGEIRNAAVSALSYEISRTNPLTALDLTSTLPAGSSRDDLLIHAVSQWAASDCDTAMKWAAKVPDRILRDRLTAAITVVGAERNPSAAATFLAQNVRPGSIQDQAAVAIVQRWAQQSPQEAADWVARFPDSAVREVAFQEVLSIWKLIDAERAGN